MQRPWAGWRRQSAPTLKPQAVSRVLRERLGVRTAVLRRFSSVALERVGDAAKRPEPAAEALNAYQEAATLLRRLDHVFLDKICDWLTDVEAKCQTTASAQAQKGDHPS